MKTFSYYIDKYTTELISINKPSQNPPKKADAILNDILAQLQKAPLYHLNAPLSNRFIQALNQYAASAEKNEKSKVSSLSTKIEHLVQQKCKEVWSCFQGNKAQHINTLLDKDPQALTEEEFGLLQNLANYLAFKRKRAQLFYRHTAIIEKIQSILKANPTILIRQTDEDWFPAIIHPIPQDPADLHFFLLVNLIGFKADEVLSKPDMAFLKKVVQRKAQSSEIGFQNFLQAYLSLYVINSLCIQRKRIIT